MSYFNSGIFIADTRISNANILYFCKVYRENEAISLWKVTFTVIKELDVLSEVNKSLISTPTSLLYVLFHTVYKKGVP